MPRVSIAPEADLSTDINVLPLIDILLVLIIIFLVAVKREFYIPAQVPPPASGGSVTGGQLVLQLRADGSMTLNQQPIPAGQLEVQLRAAFANRPAKLLFVDVAPELSYQDAITATDVAREAGVEVVAWVPHRAKPEVQ